MQIVRSLCPLYSSKMSIKNLSKTQKIKIEWSSNKYLSSNCYGGAKGQKINYNMGWLLGFRNTEITIKPGESIEADVLMDIQGPRYLVLVIEDYINNKPNNEIKDFLLVNDNFFI